MKIIKLKSWKRKYVEYHLENELKFKEKFLIDKYLE